MQDDFSDLEEVHIHGGAPVTAQPMAGQASGNTMPVFAMPPPPNPTNPFTSGTAATEATSLNTSEHSTYTPGN